MTWSAVLLAGGESRRMGTDKATMIFDGEPLWQGRVRLLRQLSLKHIFLSARTELAWRPPDLELILDEAPSRGAMSGIAAALERIDTSHLLVLAVDMPFVTLSDLLSLISLTKTGAGVVPVTSDRAEPLAAIYPKEASPEFATGLSRSDRSMQLLVRQLIAVGKVVPFPLAEADVERYRSVNTPEDLFAGPACR